MSKSMDPSRHSRAPRHSQCCPLTSLVRRLPQLERDRPALPGRSGYGGAPRHCRARAHQHGDRCDSSLVRRGNVGCECFEPATSRWDLQFQRGGHLLRRLVGDCGGARGDSSPWRLGTQRDALCSHTFGPRSPRECASSSFGSACCLKWRATPTYPPSAVSIKTRSLEASKGPIP
jgi:hypothetical protein